MKLTNTLIPAIISMLIFGTSAYAKVDLSVSAFDEATNNATDGRSSITSLQVEIIDEAGCHPLVEKIDTQPEDNEIPIMEEMKAEENIEQPEEMGFIEMSDAEQALILEMSRSQKLESVTLSMYDETDGPELITPDAPMDAPLFVARNE